MNKDNGTVPPTGTEGDDTDHWHLTDEYYFYVPGAPEGLERYGFPPTAPGATEGRYEGSEVRWFFDGTHTRVHVHRGRMSARIARALDEIDDADVAVMPPPP
ncbi:hypothetical protein GCM10008955_37790 [Deinococcus malanensis]|uniref:Uncharacterized protein n=1 Tax=Deinococcus malanensis TaxID=1706855 RepID=A0ABQ2F4P1_9DEIO|nr:hypothetical protein [Deinococcus malanensis]GGK40442.1 hypothetical protein GCM10008955_37790 [Deinococcus malanensis]